MRDLAENCHWGVVTPDDTSSAPTAEWCPFNLFRTSGDIRQTVSAAPLVLFPVVQIRQLLYYYSPAFCHVHVSYAALHRAQWASWTRNLRTALPYLDKKAPVSGPSCWAYPE